MAKKLLVDTLNIRLQLQEGSSGGKIIARGQYAIADKATANKRVYSRSLFQREINRLRQSMAERKIFGELDHPDDGRTRLQRVSHILMSLTIQDDGQVIGESQVLDTTNGKELKAILESGGSVGVSSRGYGSVVTNDQGEDVVQDDFVLDTFDFVVDPAQGTAYPEFSTESTQKPAGPATTEASEAPQAPALAAVANPEPAAPSETKPQVESSSMDKVPAKTEQIDALDWASLPENLRKEFSTRVSVAIAEQKEALRSQLTSELRADPKVAGAKEALESVKALLRPYIVEADLEKVMAAKDREIAGLKDQLAKSQRMTESVSVQNLTLSRAVKDLGFNLYLERNLRDHPNYKEMVDSLGELSEVASLDALKKRVKIFESEVAKIRIANRQDTRKLLKQKEDQILSMSEQVKSLTANNRKMAAERDDALKKATIAMGQSYLERKIVGNPNASRIRVAFDKQESKSKESVDNLVESFTQTVPPRQVGERDFDKVRARMKAGSGGRVSGLVEQALEGTLPKKPDSKIHLGEGVDLGIEEYEKLSGIKG